MQSSITDTNKKVITLNLKQMSTIVKTRRPRIAFGTLVFSTDRATKNTIKALNRIDVTIQRSFRPVSYKGVEHKLITT